MLASTINMTNTKKPTSHDHPIRDHLDLMSQGPTVCHSHPPKPPTPFHTPHPQASLQAPCSTRQSAAPTNGPSSTIPLVNTTNAPQTDAVSAGYVLLRKEVIQPHLPVRLPCYDFVPIASPTFDSSPHTRWLGHWLRVLPTFVT